MNLKDYEIIILKPTTIFLSFLATQLSHDNLPTWGILNTNQSAYYMTKKKSDDESIDELKRVFPHMFRHEISRWLGPEARNTIEHSFIDFLCCFELAYHNHIVLLDPLPTSMQHLIVVKPRQSILNWLKSVVVGDKELSHLLEQVHLQQITENATVLIKTFSFLHEIKPFLSHYYQPIFATVMSRINGNKKQWPAVHSFSDLKRYFIFEIHSQIIHMP